MGTVYYRSCLLAHWNYLKTFYPHSLDFHYCANISQHNISVPFLSNFKGLCRIAVKNTFDFQSFVY